jgi:DNA-binding response OmpR family regulator
LVQRPNRVLSRDTLLDLLKGQDWAAYDRIIDTQVARLRKKIEVNPEAPELIKTVRGIGYSFTADVTGS